MGIIISDVAFAGDVPSLDSLCAEIEAISGLRAVIVETDPNEFDKYNAVIAFACDSEPLLKVESPRSNRFIRSDWSNPKPSEDCHSCPDQEDSAGSLRPNHIRLQGYVGQDVTLLMTATIALESLGGKPSRSITQDDRREFSVKISEAELKRRREVAHRQARKIGIVGLFVLPIAIPVVMVWSVCSLIAELCRMCWTKRMA